MTGGGMGRGVSRRGNRVMRSLGMGEKLEKVELSRLAFDVAV